MRKRIADLVREAVDHGLDSECSKPPWEECPFHPSAQNKRWMDRAHKLIAADDQAVLEIVTAGGAVWVTVDRLVIGEDSFARLP